MSKYVTKIAGHILTAARDDDERREFYLAVDAIETQLARTYDLPGIKELAREHLREHHGVTMRKNAGMNTILDALLRHCVKSDKMWIGKDMELDRVARALVDYEKEVNL